MTAYKFLNVAVIVLFLSVAPFELVEISVRQSQQEQCCDYSQYYALQPPAKKKNDVDGVKTRRGGSEA